MPRKGRKRPLTLPRCVRQARPCTLRPFLTRYPPRTA